MYIGNMRQGTGHPADQLQVFLTGLVNPCTMDFVSANGSTLALVRNHSARCMNYFILAKIGNVNMKTTFQKTLIAAAAGVALMSAVGTASANSLLFPYFTTASGAQSVLQLSNTGTAPATQALHYVYNYGAACTHYDASGSMTANDIMSHSIADPATAGGFGKVVGGDTSTPVYFPLANQTGFLVVSSTTVGATDALRGSMAIVDPSTGLVVSYPGIDNALSTVTGTNEGNFTAINDLNFPLTTLPGSTVATSWYGIVVGNMQPAITAGANWDAKASFGNNGNVYNNDEVAYSGTVAKSITCSGTILATDLMTGAQATAVGTNGGLVKTTATLTAPTLGTASGVVMMKMQTVQAAVGAPFAGKQFLHRDQAGL
ncbi:MAG: hypothetical protein ABIZ09_06635 [Rhodoferax sp.]